MCIIAAKYKGHDFPTIDEIKQCMKANSHGFSVAVNKEDKISVFRTMSEDEMLEHYRNNILTLDPRTTAMIFHARIATHGTRKLSNCHCFAVPGLVFAHNGVIRDVRIKGDMTDSETFFRDYYIPALSVSREYADRIAEAMIGSSKFAFLRTGGELTLMGHFEGATNDNRRGTVYYSNGTYRTYRYDPVPPGEIPFARYGNECRQTHFSTRMRKSMDFRLSDYGISVNEMPNGEHLVRAVDYTKRRLQKTPALAE